MIDVISDLSGTVNSWLVGALVVGILFQPNAPRFYASCIVSLIPAIHEMYFKELDGFLYYFSVALFDFLIVIILSGINPLPKMVLRLQLISLAFIVVQFTGFALWFFYFPHVYYNVMSTILFSLALLTLISRDKEHVGSFAVDSWRSCFRFNLSALLLCNIKYKGAA